MLRDLILGYPTWFSYTNWVVKTVVSLPGGDLIVILQALVGLRKAGYQSNNIGLGLKVISRVGKGIALVHVNDAVPCEPQVHLIVLGTQPMIEQVVSGYSTHGKCHSSLYKDSHWNDNFTLLSICKYLVRGTIL